MRPRSPEPPGAADRRQQACAVAACANRLGFTLYPWMAGGANLVFSPVGLYGALTLLHEELGPEPGRALRGLLGASAATGIPLEPAPLFQELESAAGLGVATGRWSRGGAVAVPGPGRPGPAGGGPRTAPAGKEVSAARTCAAVDDWIREWSEGRIRRLLAPEELPPEADLLANTVRFQGLWERGFLSTRPGTFYRLDGSRTEVSMMVGLFPALGFCQQGDSWAVEVPYAGGLSLVCVVPELHGEEPLRMLEGRFAERWREVGAALHRTRPVALTMPGLAATGVHRLRESLRDAGVDGISTEVLQAVWYSADERGTGVTGAPPPTAGSSGADRLVLTIDRPFLFALTDRRTRAVVLVGRIEEPGEGGP